MSKAKFRPGDDVKIIKYGFLIYQTHDEPIPPGRSPYNFDDEGAIFDIFPEFIGRKGNVVEIKEVPLKGFVYTLDIPTNIKTFYEDQLEIA